MNLKALQPLPPPWGRARERGWKQPLATGRAVGTEEPNVPSGFVYLPPLSFLTFSHSDATRHIRSRASM